ncbi:MAG: glycoside hydrolase family 92 protein [Lentimicrobium sp.]|nr:glycoside hydrolase family 92 protein [Lentimicrobium sp.]
MNPFKYCLIAVFPVFLSLSFDSPEQKEPVDFVNPFIGTGGHGHTFPGPTAPFGMIQLSPDTRLEGWDGCSGYHYSDEYIYGFSHTHLSGTGVPDYCDILLMPFTGAVELNNGSDGSEGYRSKFSHNNETASPGYYQVFLDDHKINVELTATTRVGIHKYSYPEGKPQSVLLDLKHRDQVTDSWLKVSGNNEIEGFRGSTGWARDQKVYFVARFSKSIKNSGIALNDSVISHVDFIRGKNVKAWFNFDETDGTPLIIKVGISAVSVENARLNIETETPDWDFDKIRLSTTQLWNKELKKIQVKTKSADRKSVFYTALYHTMLSPNTYSDVDGSYLGRDFNIHKTVSGNYYTVFSLWDTYRALHPLMTIIDQKRTNEFINTFILQYQQGGLLPVWELSANETWCMIGYHAVPVIADAWMKGIRGYDGNEALKAMLKSASADMFGLEYYRKYGFIPAGLEHESVSKTLEYAYDDWCIAVMAGSLGSDSISRQFYKRAQAYKHLFDSSTGFMRARINGGWYKPFDPSEVNFNYTEANSWQYSFSVTHDMENFISMHGGKNKASDFLDSLFSVSSATTGRDQSDITGLIGQYAHGNEPSHHIAYLYNYCGKPWKTQEKISNILRNFYKNSPDGLIGNEDCGQMSAWAVLSAMGIYPVCPGSEQYAIGSPEFEETSVHLENGNTFKFIANNVSEKNIYIQSALLNGKKFNRSYLNHSEIMSGGELVFEMGPAPSPEFGAGAGNEPVTSINSEEVLTAPFASPSDRMFKNELLVSLNAEPGAKITYTIDGSEPGPYSQIYAQPIRITETTNLKFKAFKPGYESAGAQESSYTRMPEDLEIVSLTEYASQYSGNGKNNLIDGLKGSNDFRLGNWQGFQGQDVEAVLHISHNQPVKSIKTGCFQDINSWIFMPSMIELWSSANGIDYSKLAEIKNDFPSDKWGVFVKDFTFENLNINDRYLKVRIVNAGPCPEWHPGKGNPTWIFIDEISFSY